MSYVSFRGSNFMWGITSFGKILTDSLGNACPSAGNSVTPGKECISHSQYGPSDCQWRRPDPLWSQYQSMALNFDLNTSVSLSYTRKRNFHVHTIFSHHHSGIILPATIANVSLTLSPRSHPGNCKNTCAAVKIHLLLMMEPPAKMSFFTWDKSYGGFVCICNGFILHQMTWVYKWFPWTTSREYQIAGNSPAVISSVHSLQSSCKSPLNYGSDYL